MAVGCYVVMKIHQRSNGYWYVRKRVPADVRDVIGKTELWESLQTKDKELAAVRAPAVMAEVNQLIAEARLKLSPKPKDNLWLTPKDAHVLADMCLSHAVQLMDEAGNTKRVTKRSLARYFEHCSDEKTAGEYVSDFLASQGVSVSPKSKVFKQLAATVVEHLDKLEEVAFGNRLAGDWRSQPDIQFTRADLTRSGQGFLDNSITINALYDDYKATELAQAAASQKPALLKRFRDIDQVVRWFIGHVGGDMAVQQVTKQHASTFVSRLILRPVTKRRDIKALPLEDQIAWAEKGGEKRVASNTVKKDVRLFQSLFSVAVDHHYIEENPFTGSLKRVARKAAKSSPKKTGYSDLDLKKVFGSDLFQHKFEPIRKVDTDYGLAVFWVPLICYYTGARLNEVAQLHLSDVRQEEGVWCIDINPNADDKRTKNGEPRIVPLHQHLIDLGFVEYVEEQRRSHLRRATATSHRVFPGLKPNTDGNLSAGLSRVLGTKLKALGLPEGIQPVHAFRHTFKTAMRHLNVAEDVHDAITGHAGASVGRGYGGVAVQTANAAIQKLERVTLPVDHYTQVGG